MTETMWTTALVAVRKVCDDLAKLVESLPHHGAVLFAVGIATGNVTAPKTRKADGTPVLQLRFPFKDPDDDTGKNRIGAEALTGVPHGNLGSLLAGILFALCAMACGTKGAKTATTTTAWSVIMARFGIHTANDCREAQAAMSQWYRSVDDDDNPVEVVRTVASLRAAIAEALTPDDTDSDSDTDTDTDTDTDSDTGTDAKLPVTTVYAQNLRKLGTSADMNADIDAAIDDDRRGIIDTANRLISRLEATAPTDG